MVDLMVLIKKRKNYLFSAFFVMLKSVHLTGTQIHFVIFNKNGVVGIFDIGSQDNIANHARDERP